MNHIELRSFSFYGSVSCKHFARNFLDRRFQENFKENDKVPCRRTINIHIFMTPHLKTAKQKMKENIHIFSFFFLPLKKCSCISTDDARSTDIWQPRSIALNIALFGNTISKQSPRSPINNIE